MIRNLILNVSTRLPPAALPASGVTLGPRQHGHPNEPFSSRRSTLAQVSRLSSTATAGSIWLMLSLPALPTASVSLLSALAMTDSSTAAIDATKMPIWRSDMSGYSFCRLSAAERRIRRIGACSFAAQIDELRSSGSAVEAIFPDSSSLDAFGSKMMDLSRRRSSALAGYEQGMAHAARLTNFWR